MNGVTFAMDDTSWFLLINMGLSLLILGAFVYGFILFVKAARRIIRVCDIYLLEKAEQKRSE